MFTIDIDTSRSFVSVRLNGFMDVAEAKAYVARVEAEFVGKIGSRPYVMMIDTSGAPLQSQAVFETFAAHIGHFPKAQRIALVTGGSLARMQLRRLLTRDYAEFFDTPAEAMAWLFAPKPEVHSQQAGQGAVAA